MTHYPHEQVLPCDIDNTLILWGSKAKGSKLIEIESPYETITEVVGVHEPHVKLLKNRLDRGALILAWSANGNRWAKAVLNALGLDHPNLIVMSKPFAYIDDKPCEEWMGDQVYLSPQDEWGKNGQS